MSEATEIVSAFMATLETKEYGKATGYLSDTFLFGGFTPKPLPKDQFIMVTSGLGAGFPGLSYNFHNVQEVDNTAEGAQVTGTVRITGAQTDSFILPPLGLAPIPQMAGSVSLPEATWEFLVRDDKIVSIRVDRVPGADMEGLLNQLGIKDPIIQ